MANRNKRTATIAIVWLLAAITVMTVHAQEDGRDWAREYMRIEPAKTPQPDKTPEPTPTPTPTPDLILPLLEEQQQDEETKPEPIVQQDQDRDQETEALWGTGWLWNDEEGPGVIKRTTDILAVAWPPNWISSDKDEEYDDYYYEEFEDEFNAEGQTIADPIKPWNLVWFHFNDRLYFWAIKPFAKGYGFVLPKFMRLGLDNFFENLEWPIRLFNNSLQGKFKRAGIETERFFVNTTIGVAGFFDPATHWLELDKYPEDFDQTLAVWHIGPGFYITWPIFGPRSARGTLGMVFDIALDPATYGTGGGALEQVNDVSLGQTPYETLREMAIDPYTAVRNAYYQNRLEVIAE